MKVDALRRLSAGAAPAMTPEDLQSARERLSCALERLEGLHDAMAQRHGLLSTGMSRLEGLRQTVIAQLDALEGDADLEPSLGFPAQLLPMWSNRATADCTVLPRDLGPGDDREQDADLEPSLCGSTADYRPHRYSDWSDGELEHDGREPECEDEGAQCDDEGVDTDRELEDHCS